MARALSCLALAVAALLAAPAFASANADVSLENAIGILEIVGDDTSDAIVVTQGANSMLVERTGGGLTASGDCTAVGVTVTCPKAAMVAVDLRGGNDTFSSIAVTVPESIAGGDGDD